MGDITPKSTYWGEEKGGPQFRFRDDVVHSTRSLFSEGRSLYDLRECRKKYARYNPGPHVPWRGDSTVTTQLVHVIYLVCNIAAETSCMLAMTYGEVIMVHNTVR